MNNHAQLKREARYGLPAADQILYNRHYILGYSYYFRQAKWALEIIDPDKSQVKRVNNFRSDYRIPEAFRADKEVYENSGYERGHLVASANQIETQIQNSETFLLSNMCPQKPECNKGAWKELEDAVRTLNNSSKVLETYVISGPLFYFDKEVVMMGSENCKVSLPIPHAFFKSVLIEKNTGTINVWSFIIPNETDCNQELSTYLVKTTKVEKIAGISLWETLLGTKISKKKNRITKMWKY